MRVWLGTSRKGALVTEFDRLRSYLPRPSEVSDHGHDCCEEARQWLWGMDFSLSRRGGTWLPPTWIKARFEWGPLAWPISWCAVPRQKILDCGAFAAVALLVLAARRERAVPVQVIQTFSEENVQTWRDRWAMEERVSNWTAGRWAYHECVALVEGEEVRIWDPTNNNWLDPMVIPNSYGGVVAMRIPARKWMPTILRFGPYEFRTGDWVEADPLSRTGGRLS